MIKKVHVVYKTHLDIGFTDYAEDVIEKYFNDYIPRAITLGKELNKEKKQFIWTTGSWLIYKFLKEASEDGRKELENAIRRGDICWHGLPFTTHTELMNKRLFNYGLSYSKNLDERFGRKTIAAKMTDVPGHTKGIIKEMENNGIKYLHLGVNPASCPPNVPKIFLWKDGENQIIVNYAGEYGEEVAIDGGSEILVFAHSDDNCGPPSKREALGIIEKYERKYPEAEVIGSTLDAFARYIETFSDKFPVISEEIGDTWIHGIGSDPEKVRQYRLTLRKIEEWVNTGKLSEKSGMYSDLMDHLIMIPEHTWGQDLKLHLCDYNHYSKEDFNSALKTDIITDEKAIPEKYLYISKFSMNNQENLGRIDQRSYSKFERSWDEQRSYNKLALNTLPLNLKKEIENEINCELSWDERDKNLAFNVKLGSYEVEIEKTGALSSVIYKDEELLEGPTGEYIFKMTGEDEYEKWFRTYMQNLDITYKWSISDFSKPGMELMKKRIKESVIHTPRIVGVETNSSLGKLRIIAEFKVRKFHNYDLPERVEFLYTFNEKQAEVTLELKVAGISKIRLPHEQWISFKTKTSNPSNWKMVKLGKDIDPFKIVDRGNMNLHCVERVHNGQLTLEPLDSPLVSFNGRKILNFNEKPEMTNTINVNLYNNIWGTNFPMWYSGDIKSKFIIKK